MNIVESSDFRIQELAAGVSLGDLSEAELHEIKSYDPKIFQAMVESSEEAAARTFLTFNATFRSESMPSELTVRLKNMAIGFFDETNIMGADTSATPMLSAHSPQIAPSSMGLREITAWLCMAASIALALIMWLPGTSVRTTSLQLQRDYLIASAPDLLRSKWESSSPDQKPGMDLGEVVWSTASQQGFMTIKGLPVNDANKEQYQLWIIDPTRDEKPVDGGVFNIESRGESVVSIAATGE